MSALAGTNPIAVPESTREVLGRRDVTVWAIGVLTLATLALRFSQIGQTLLGDETFSYFDIIHKSFGAVVSNVHTGGENSPPLYFMLAWLSIHIGDPTEWIRLPSILLGAATVPVVYAIGRMTVGRWAGLAAAALLAASPFTIYYGVEARPYATMTFFVALSLLLLLRAVDTGRRGWWAGYTLAVAAAAYSHYTCVFVLVVAGAWSLWAARRQLVTALVANLAVPVLYIPWLPHVRGKALAVIGGLQPLTAHNMAVDLVRITMGYPYATVHQIPTWPGFIVFVLCLAAGLAFALGPRLRLPALRTAAGRLDDVPPRRLGLLVMLALATPVGLFLYSELDTDLWLARGLSASLPAIALVLGYLLTRPPRPVAALACAGALAVLIAGTVKAVQVPFERSPYRAVASYLDRRMAPSEPIDYVTLVGGPALQAEMRLHPPAWSTLVLLAHPPAAGRRVWVVADDRVVHVLGIADVRRVLPIRYTLISDRHFDGLYPTDVLLYRSDGPTAAG
jgi:hypothetical protein